MSKWPESKVQLAAELVAGQLDGICWVEQGRPHPGLLAIAEARR